MNAKNYFLIFLIVPFFSSLAVDNTYIFAMDSDETIHTMIALCKDVDHVLDLAKKKIEILKKVFFENQDFEKSVEDDLDKYFFNDCDSNGKKRIIAFESYKQGLQDILSFQKIDSEEYQKKIIDSLFILEKFDKKVIQSDTLKMLFYFALRRSDSSYNTFKFLYCKNIIKKYYNDEAWWKEKFACDKETSDSCKKNALMNALEIFSKNIKNNDLDSNSFSFDLLFKNEKLFKTFIEKFIAQKKKILLAIRKISRSTSDLEIFDTPLSFGDIQKANAVFEKLKKDKKVDLKNEKIKDEAGGKKEEKSKESKSEKDVGEKQGYFKHMQANQDNFLIIDLSSYASKVKNEIIKNPDIDSFYDAMIYGNEKKINIFKKIFKWVGVSFFNENEIQYCESYDTYEKINLFCKDLIDITLEGRKEKYMRYWTCLKKHCGTVLLSSLLLTALIYVKKKYF